LRDRVHFPARPVQQSRTVDAGEWPLSEIRNSLSPTKDNPLDYVGRKVKAAGLTITLRPAADGDNFPTRMLSLIPSITTGVRKYAGWTEDGRAKATWDIRDGKDIIWRNLLGWPSTFEVQAKNASLHS
jgi:hypothetical protein